MHDRLWKLINVKKKSFKLAWIESLFHREEYVLLFKLMSSSKSLACRVGQCDYSLHGHGRNTNNKLVSVLVNVHCFADKFLISFSCLSGWHCTDGATASRDQWRPLRRRQQDEAKGYRERYFLLAECNNSLWNKKQFRYMLYYSYCFLELNISIITCGNTNFVIIVWPRAPLSAIWLTRTNLFYI